MNAGCPGWGWLCSPTSQALPFYLAVNLIKCCLWKQVWICIFKPGFWLEFNSFPWKPLFTPINTPVWCIMCWLQPKIQFQAFLWSNKATVEWIEKQVQRRRVRDIRSFLLDAPMQIHRRANTLIPTTFLGVASSLRQLMMVKPIVLSPWIDIRTLSFSNHLCDELGCWMPAPGQCQEQIAGFAPCRNHVGLISPWNHQPPCEFLIFVVISPSFLLKTNEN